jgi:glycolate oxidase
MIASLDSGVLDELRAIVGDDDRVLDNVSSRVVRTRVPAPFPVHGCCRGRPRRCRRS